MKELVFAATVVFCLQAALVVTSRAEGKAAQSHIVSVTEGSITMPTYRPTAREKEPPLFADSAVTGLYPFPTFSASLEPKPSPQNYKAIFVENEYLKLTYVPAFGGRFLSLYDKLRKREVFYKNDVFKPTRFNARGNWIQEGIELTGPFDVHSLTESGDPAWSNTVVRNHDGSVTLVLGEIDPIYGMNISLSATLYPSVAAMQISVFCFNPNASRMPQMFWTNASFPSTPATRFLYPMTRTVGHNTGQVTDWPLYNGVDYSWDRNNKNMLGVFGIDLYDNFGGAYQFDQDYGVFRYADRRVVQGMKMWTFGHGRDAASMERSYTDKAGPYFEAQSGRHVWDGHYEWVAPHQVERWNEWWIPVAGIKGLTTLTTDVALNLRVDAASGGSGSTIQMDLSPVRPFTDAKLTVRSNKAELLNQQLDLRPGTSVRKVINSAASPGDLRDVEVLITDRKGTTLLEYRRPNAGEIRSEYTPFTKELEKPSKEPAAMSAEELLLAAEFRLKELDSKGALDLLSLSLQRDAGYSAAHTLKGIIFYKDGQLHEAEAELEKAVYRDPYADQAWYYLAVTQIGLGNVKSAERNLYYIWPNSSYYGNREYQLGRLEFLHGNYPEAIDHLKGAVNASGQDLSAHLLLAITFRISGNLTGASSEIAKMIEIDPSDRGAYAERFFLTKDSAASIQLRHLMSDQTQEAMRVADLYSSLNRWQEAVEILRMEENHPGETSSVFYYTLGYDLKKVSDKSASLAQLAKARNAGGVVDRFPYLASSEAPLVDAVALDPSDSVARFNLGCLLYYQKRFDEAIAQWEAAAKTRPADFSIQRSLGLAYAERGETDRATAKLEAAVALDGTHLGTVSDLATLYARTGRTQDEVTLLHQSIKRSPENDDLLIRLLHVDLVQGRYKEANEIVQTHTFSPRHRSDELRDEYRALKYAEGSRAFTSGDYKQALDLFHSAETPPSTLGVDDFQFQSAPRLGYYVGRTLEALNRKAEAVQVYEQAVKDVDLTAGDRASFNSDNFFMLLSLDRLGRKRDADELVGKFEDFAKSQLSLGSVRRRSEGQYILALVMLQQGRTDEAARLMQASLKTESDFLPPLFDLRGDSIGTSVSTKGSQSISTKTAGRVALR